MKLSRLLSELDFNKKIINEIKKILTYKDRWSYYGEVVNFLKDKDFENVLEIGSGIFPLVKDSDRVDLENNPTYRFDLNNTPWKLTKHYDLVIGLEVLEHLKDPEDIFKEIKRVSDYAIISLPYKWQDYNSKVHLHHNIDEKIIKNWFKIEPVESIKAKAWLILFYDFKKNNSNDDSL